MNDEFVLSYHEYSASQQPLREALCTLGNGYFAARGAFEFEKAGGAHYPGIYLAGGYNRLETKIAGQILENEDLVNWPNWLYLTFRIDNGEWFSIGSTHIITFKQMLDLKKGTFAYHLTFRDTHGRQSTLDSTRIVHMGNPHLALIKWILTPDNWSGSVTVHSALDANVTNSGVQRYRALNGNHLRMQRADLYSEECIYLEVMTSQSHIHMSQAARVAAYSGNEPLPVQRTTIYHESSIAQELTFNVTMGHAVQIETVVSLYTSKDMAISEPTLEACKNLVIAPDFDSLATTHIRAWEELWDRFDIEIKGEEQSQRIIRLHIFHILQTASPNSYDLDVGIPPPGFAR